MYKRWSMWFIYRYLTDGGRNGLRLPVLFGCWLSCTKCWLHVLSMKWLIHIPMMFLSTDYLFEKKKKTKNGLDHGPPDLQTKLRIISWSVLGLATYFPCGVSGSRWTTCLLYDVQILGLGFKCQFMCMLERYFPLIACLCLCFCTLPKFC